MRLDEPQALPIPSPHYFPARYGHLASFIVIHAVPGGMSAEHVARLYQGTMQAAPHYVVDQRGIIAQCVEEQNGAWCNGGITGVPGPSGLAGDGIHHDPWWTPELNPNLVTISIQFVKTSLDNSDPLTAAQEKAGFALIQRICDRNMIPPRAATAEGGITGHFSLDPVNEHHCPGAFPFDRLYAFLEQGMMVTLDDPLVAEYFEDIGNGQWRCRSNGKILHGPILSFYQAMNGLVLFRLPLTDEWYPRPGTAMQRFEGAVLCWDPHHVLDHPIRTNADVYVAKIYEGLAIDPRLENLNHQYQSTQSSLQNALAQITTLTGQLSKPQQPDDLSIAIKSALAGLKPLVDRCAVSEQSTQGMPSSPVHIIPSEAKTVEAPSV